MPWGSFTEATNQELDHDCTKHVAKHQSMQLPKYLMQSQPWLVTSMTSVKIPGYCVYSVIGLQCASCVDGCTACSNNVSSWVHVTMHVNMAQMAFVSAVVAECIA